MKNKAKILISGSYGTGNVGDEIILHCILDELKDFNLTVLSQGPEYTKKNFSGIRVVAQTPSWEIKRIIKDIVFFNVKQLKGRFLFLKELVRADYFFLGGGGLLAEMVPRVLRYYCHQIVLAHFFRCKVVLLTVGVGPLKTIRGKDLLSKVINRIPFFISVRDEYSQNNLKQIGVTKKIYTVPDPAFLFKSENKSCANTVVVNFYRTFDDATLWPAMSFRKDILMNSLEKIIEHIINELKYNVIILPFGSSNDKDFAQETLLKIVTRNPSLAPSISLHNGINYLDIAEVLASARWSITMRFHAGLISLAHLKPSVCIDQQFKSERMLKEMNLEELLICLPDGYHKEGDHNVEFMELKNKVTEMEKNYDDIQHRISLYQKKSKIELTEFWNTLRKMIK